jgi:hypothetical protein
MEAIVMDYRAKVQMRRRDNSKQMKGVRKMGRAIAPTLSPSLRKKPRFDFAGLLFTTSWF